MEENVVEMVDEAIEEARNRDHLTYAGDAFLRSLRGLLRTFVDVGPAGGSAGLAGLR